MEKRKENKQKRSKGAVGGSESKFCLQESVPLNKSNLHDSLERVCIEEETMITLLSELIISLKTSS